MKYAVFFIVAALVCTFAAGVSYAHGHPTACAVLWLAVILLMVLAFVPAPNKQTVKG